MIVRMASCDDVHVMYQRFPRIRRDVRIFAARYFCRRAMKSRHIAIWINLNG